MQPQRGGGVARHAIEMVNGLLHRPGVDGTLLASGPDMRRHPAFAGHFPGIAVRTHALPGKLLERSWKAIGWPSLTRHCRGFDVIYAPADVRFPTCGIPSVVTIHDVQALEEHLPWSDTSAHRSFRDRWMRWLPAVLREADCIVTVSEFSKRRMVELLDADPARIVVVGNGVSAPFFNVAAPPSGGTHASVVIVGGLRLKKGAAATLRVADELHRRKSPLTIDIYGHHDPDWAARASGHPNVRLHDFACDADLAAALASSTALLFLSPYEGFGIPAVEAMAAGTPAVVANAASLPEVVGDAGIIVDAEDAAGVADALERLRVNLLFRAGRVAAGRQRAAEFTWQSCVQRLLEALQKVVSGRG